MKNIITLILFLTFTSQTLGAKTDARVIKVRGKVTALLPGKHHVVRVKKGDLFPEDTSLLTRSRAFIKLKYSDGSVITLGPKSKIILKASMTRNKAGVLSLLKGSIRSNVNKRSKLQASNKLIIKSRTASLGVRGTDFLVVYNEENKAFSLVTFEGDVAVVKAVKGRQELAKLDKMLQESKVSVKEGEFVGVNKQTKKLKKSERIDKTQLRALDRSTQQVVSTLSSKKERLITVKNALADLKTGQLVKPTIGKVDKVTGFFVAPKGLNLTSKGFVALNKESRENIKLAESLNVVMAKEPFLHEFFLGASYYTFRSEAQQVSTGSEGAFSDDGSIRFEAKYLLRQKLHTYFLKASFFKLSPQFKGCQFCLPGDTRFESETYTDVALGYEYNFTESLKIGMELGSFSRPFLTPSSVSFNINKEEFTNISMFGRYNLFSSYSIQFFVKQRFDAIMSEHTDGVGFGYKTTLGLERALTESLNISFALFRGEESFDSNDYEFINTTGGLESTINIEF